MFFVAVFSLFALAVHGQTESITGKVVDEKSRPIVDAMIKELGTNNGVFTQDDLQMELVIHI